MKISSVNHFLPPSPTQKNESNSADTAEVFAKQQSVGARPETRKEGWLPGAATAGAVVASETEQDTVLDTTLLSLADDGAENNTQPAVISDSDADSAIVEAGNDDEGKKADRMESLLAALRRMKPSKQMTLEEFEQHVQKLSSIFMKELTGFLDKHGFSSKEPLQIGQLPDGSYGIIGKHGKKINDLIAKDLRMSTWMKKMVHTHESLQYQKEFHMFRELADKTLAAGDDKGYALLTKRWINWNKMNDHTVTLTITDGKLEAFSDGKTSEEYLTSLEKYLTRPVSKPIEIHEGGVGIEPQGGRNRKGGGVDADIAPADEQPVGGGPVQEDDPAGVVEAGGTKRRGQGGGILETVIVGTMVKVNAPPRTAEEFEAYVNEIMARFQKAFTAFLESQGFSSKEPLQLGRLEDGGFGVLGKGMEKLNKLIAGDFMIYGMLKKSVVVQERLQYMKEFDAFRALASKAKEDGNQQQYDLLSARWQEWSKNTAHITTISFSVTTITAYSDGQKGDDYVKQLIDFLTQGKMTDLLQDHIHELGDMHDLESQ